MTRSFYLERDGLWFEVSREEYMGAEREAGFTGSTGMPATMMFRGPVGSLHLHGSQLTPERYIDKWGICSVCRFRFKVSCSCGLTFKEKIKTVKLDEEALRRCSQGPGNDWPKPEKK